MNKIYFINLIHKTSDKLITWGLNNFFSLVLIIILGFLAFKLSNFFLKHLKLVLIFSAKKNMEDDLELDKRVTTLVGIINKIVQVSIWSIVLMLLLIRFGINIAPILAGAGILGLAVGFGAQELVKDVISGFFILLENYLRTGDTATINNTTGLVEKVGLRSIILRDSTGTMHIFQNGKINSLSNLTKDWSAIVLDIGVSYQENLDKVKNVMLLTADALIKDYGAKIIAPVEFLGVDDFHETAVVIKIRFKTKPAEQWLIGREYRIRLFKAFAENMIELKGLGKK
ncbi:MAG: mechanosensitive ion channel family protein [Candidatus Margulisiibacteriota bacterium]|jgi:small conductance mechanosensitive channel